MNLCYRFTSPATNGAHLNYNVILPSGKSRATNAAHANVVINAHTTDCAHPNAEDVKLLNY